MSALPPKSPATVAPFSDALGYRVLGFDKKSGDRLEMLRLRPQLASSPAFEAAVRERQRRLADFRHAAYARVRQIDRPAGQNAALAIVSNYADGQRLSELLRSAQNNAVPIELIVGMCLLQQMVAAVAQLHAIGGDLSHGALNPERIVVTPAGRIVVTEYVAGAGLALARPDAAAGVAGLSPGAAVGRRRSVHPGLGRLSARLSRPDAGERPLDLRPPVSAAVRDAAERRRGDRHRRPHAAAAPGHRQLADARAPPRRAVRLGDRRAGVARRGDRQRRARRHAGRRRRLRGARRRRDRRRAGHHDQHAGAAGGRTARAGAGRGAAAGPGARAARRQDRASRRRGRRPPPSRCRRRSPAATPDRTRPTCRPSSRHDRRTAGRRRGGRRARRSRPADARRGAARRPIRSCRRRRPGRRRSGTSRAK